MFVCCFPKSQGNPELRVPHPLLDASESNDWVEAEIIAGNTTEGGYGLIAEDYEADPVR